MNPGTETEPARRCVVFHDLAEAPGPLTRGLGVTLSPRRFGRFLDHVARCYEPVGLSRFVAPPAPGRARPPLLITFDDAYRSVVEVALPMLRERGLPALFFVNSGTVGSRRLAFDNLAAYVFDVFGAAKVRDFLRRRGQHVPEQMTSVSAFLLDHVASIPLAQRQVLADDLTAEFAVDHEGLIERHRPYVDWEDLERLAAGGVEIGGHGRSHTFLRQLGHEELAAEVTGCKHDIESRVRTVVRSFSVPYGSSADLTPTVAAHLKASGYETVFLVEGTTRSHGDDLRVHDRISLKRHGRLHYFVELRLLPRLRSLRRGR